MMTTSYFLIYKTTNLVNGKVYIGKHKTNCVEDGYLGSGKLLRYAIRKYGVEKFAREILYDCSSEDEMNKIEAELVTESFCNESSNYNLCRGGMGGFSFINREGINNSNKDKEAIKAKATARMIGKKNPKGSERLIKWHEEGRLKPPNTKGRVQSDEEREMRRQLKLQNPSKMPSQSGTVWITNGTLNKKQKAVDPIPEGWYKGRVK